MTADTDPTLARSKNVSIPISPSGIGRMRDRIPRRHTQPRRRNFVSLLRTRYAGAIERRRVVKLRAQFRHPVFVDNHRGRDREYFARLRDHLRRSASARPALSPRPCPSFANPARAVSLHAVDCRSPENSAAKAAVVPMIQTGSRRASHSPRNAIAAATSTLSRDAAARCAARPELLDTPADHRRQRRLRHHVRRRMHRENRHPARVGEQHRAQMSDRRRAINLGPRDDMTSAPLPPLRGPAGEKNRRIRRIARHPRSPARHT